jgi:hypothetical protein
MFENNKHFRRRFHPLKIGFFILVFAAFVLALGGVVMLLWNAILPDTVGVKPLTYWKALGLLILAKILFGGFRRPGSWGGSGRNKERKKWMNMSDEERQQFKLKWKTHCRKRDSLTKEDKGQTFLKENEED